MPALITAKILHRLDKWLKLQWNIKCLWALMFISGGIYINMFISGGVYMHMFISCASILRC